MDDDDDLYGGYTATSSSFNPAPNDDEFNYDAPTAAGGPGGPMRQGTAGGRLGTAAPARPMTASNKAAGYSGGRPGTAVAGGPAVAGSKGPAPPLRKKPEDGPDVAIKEHEAKCHELLEASSRAQVDKDWVRAVETAREACKRERQLARVRENAGMGDSENLELAFATQLCLGNALEGNDQIADAMDTYTQIVKNKAFVGGGRVRVNMGNVYFNQKDYQKAIKMYRMAIDQVPANQRWLRMKITRNVAMAFIRMGQYVDAANTLGEIMDNEPDVHTGFQLVVCHYAVGDKDKMKRAFIALLKLRAYESDEPDEDGDDTAGGAGPGATRRGATADDVLGDDGLRQMMREKQLEARRKILQAAKLIGPKISANKELGYEFLLEEMHAHGYEFLANELEMEQALAHLRGRGANFEEGKRALKEFEKKEHALKARAATNLSFLYFAEGDFENAEKYADMSVESNRYDASALVNKGNCMLQRGDMEGARDCYLEAVGVEADCVDAIYNLGLVNKRLEQYQDALVNFRKVISIIPNDPEATWQLADVCELMGNMAMAIKQFDLLHARLPTDPGVLARLGALHAAAGDEAKALQCYNESHRVYPPNIPVIEWLGTYHAQQRAYEKAHEFFAFASEVKPRDTKWPLLAASCQRRAGKLADALETYKSVHARNPDNAECLRHIVNILTDLGRTSEAAEYDEKLSTAESRGAGSGGDALSAAEKQKPLIGRAKLEMPEGGLPPDEESPHAPETPGRALNQSVMSDEFGMGGVLDDELLPGM